MRSSMWVATFLFLLKSTSSQKCVMKGADDNLVPTFFDGPPFKLDSAHNDALRNICPHLIAKDTNSTLVCCEEKQVNILVEQLSLLGSLLQSCEQCKFSFTTAICNLACSPKQSAFIEVTSNKESKLITKAIYNLSKEFLDGVFNSCKDTKNSQTGEKVINSLGCRDNCTGKKLLQGLFGLSPYNITLVENRGASVHPDEEKFYPCSEKMSINGKVYKECSCAHCKATCNKNVTFTDPARKLFFNFLSYYDIAVLCVWTLIIIAIVAFFIMRCTSRRSRQSLTSNTNSITVSDRGTEINGATDEGKHKISIILRGMKYFIDRLCRLTVKHRYISMAFFLIIAIGLSVSSIFRIQLTSDPMDLWVPPNAKITNNYKDFNRYFGGFFRIEQIIITSKIKGEYSGSYNGAAFNKDLFIFTAQLLEKIKKVKANYSSGGKNHTVQLKDICYKPTAPEVDACVITSPIEYFEGSLKTLLKSGDNWITHVSTCIENSAKVEDKINENLTISCLSTFLAPVDPKLVFGGYSDADIRSADTIIMTFTVRNHEKKEDQMPAIHWEREFIKIVKTVNNNHNYSISFNSEISVEDELYRGSFKDVKIAGLSYFLMFMYVCLGIGKFSLRFKDMLVDLKICTAVGGILIIVLSVSTTIGIFSLSGYKINLIVIEVLPFLLLAIGADNFFLLDHYFMSSLMTLYEKGDLNLKIATRKAIRKAGVGICISSLVNTCTFFIGVANDMPVVKFFSLASAIAMIITFIFQIGIFIPLMFCDNLRMMSNRACLFFCKLKENEDHPVGDRDRYREGPVRKYVRKVHQNIVTHRYAAYSIVTFFCIAWGAMIICASKLNIGLDQKLALPTDSYLQQYFDSVFDKLKVGAPFFAVITGELDYRQEQVQNKICSLSFCDENSLGNLLAFAAEKSNETRIATPTNNWIDTYLQWLAETALPSCCMVAKQELDKSGKVIRNITNFTFCSRDMYDSKKYNCESCLPSSRSPARPTEDEFGLLLPYFLNDMPTLDGCILGGKPAFKDSVVLNPSYYSIPRTSNFTVLRSRFMGYHTQLVTSSSFIDALRKAVKIQNMLTSILGVDTYLYSIFYVYYQGYLGLVYHAILLYGLMCLGLVLFSFVIFFFKLRISVIYSATVVMTNVTILFLMFIFEVNLNPVSLVNIIMMFAISVEFTIHIAVAYMSSKNKSPSERARAALLHSGASVFSGIAITKIIGVAILAFASSKIFIEYYFKMYCFAIISGMLHGLIFLPACLSIFGPEGEDDSDYLPVSLTE